MNPLVLEALAAVFRWGLAILAGYLVQAGIWDASAATVYVTAGAVALASLSWSLYQKYVARTKLVTSLSMGPSTENKVEKQIALGKSAPVSTPKDEQAKHDV